MGTRHFECRTFDLSDNSPYISSVILAPEECKKNTQERYEIVKSEPAQSPVRRTFSADETAGASKNFECCTFDHSDNSPCLFSSGFLSRNLLKNSLERKQERRQKIFDFEIFCVEEYQGESGGRNSQLLPKFRVNPVMTASIRFHIRLKHGKTRFAHTILSVLREKVKRFLAKRLTYTGQCGYNNCVL